jgi:hypothetical protein
LIYECYIRVNERYFGNFVAGLEIPDDDGERLMTPELIKGYICDKEDIFE